jgi:aryl-alcohol dehydrogenase-like predicted oxidoreductase
MSFTETTLTRVGKPVHRLGLALNYGLDPSDLEAAVERGPNYLFWTQSMRKMAEPVKRVLARDRDRMVLATGPTLGFFAGGIHRACERLLKQLGTDYIDVFHLFWVGKSSALTEGTMEALVKLREAGKVRAIAVSIHDRPRAGRLAADSPLDMLMVRYNAAHPGAERDIFPHLHPDKQLVSYTSTAWKKLLSAPSGWTGAVPTAMDCYRFALSAEQISVTLCAPANLTELDQNLAALDRGPLSEDEQSFMREFGKAAHSMGMRDSL